MRLRCLHEKAFVRLEVLDTGIDIPASQLPYICDEFYQVDVPSNTRRDGYGLGLSIVQRIAKLLDVKLDVHSVIGHGSTFALTVPVGRVPVAPTRAGGPPAATAARSAARSPHVLFVEDDEAVRSATRLLLKVAGYRVTAAASLAEALDCARRHADIDLLVTDYHLGGNDTGMQAITAVRAQLGPDLRAVLVTGDTSSAVSELSCDARTRITSKPINADDFLALLEALVRPGADA